MKNLIAISALALSFNSFAGEYLVKYNSNSGFSPVPMSSETKVLETGKVIKTVRRGNATPVKTEKTISPNLVQKIKDNVDAINAKDKVVDPNPNGPRCMDAPSHTYSVSKNGKDVTIATWFSCHKSSMKSKAAQDLVKTMDSLNESLNK